MAKNFEDLEVWQRGCRLTVQVYKAINHFKDYSLKDQIRRAAVSIPSNIAEGAERNYQKDFIRFLRISKGSTAELRTQLYLAMKLEMLDNETGKSLAEESKDGNFSR